jgi:hypothetical protein
MSKYSIQTIIFLFLASVLLAQDTIKLAANDLSNPELMKVLNNYFGCKTWSNGICIECSERYYFNAKGICC